MQIRRNERFYAKWKECGEILQLDFGIFLILSQTLVATNVMNSETVSAIF